MSQPRFSAEIVVASSNAAYFTTNEGQILAACSQDQQPHPRSFLTDLDLSVVQVGQRIYVEDNYLCFNSGLKLDWGQRTLWQRTPPSADDAAPMKQLRFRIESLLKAALELQESEFRNHENFSLALQFLKPDSDSSNFGRLPNGISPLVQTGVAQIKELLPFCRRGNLGTVLGRAEQLIGLGHGLTPSGDDFVGGLLFMTRHLAAVHAADQWWEDGDISKLLTCSKPLTSTISHSLLTDLAEGQSHDSLHDLADGLLCGKREFDAAQHVRSVTQIGQSSGWDMLTGILAGLLPVVYRA